VKAGEMGDGQADAKDDDSKRDGKSKVMMEMRMD
jgi:hypothetical protein